MDGNGRWAQARGLPVLAGHREGAKALKRTVILAVADRGWMSGVHATLPAAWAGKAEQYWPDIDGLDYRDAVTDFTLPRGTFFDGATIHLITIATLIKLHHAYRKGRAASSSSPGSARRSRSAMRRSPSPALAAAAS